MKGLEQVGVRNFDKDEGSIGNWRAYVKDNEAFYLVRCSINENRQIQREKVFQTGTRRRASFTLSHVPCAPWPAILSRRSLDVDGSLKATAAAPLALNLFYGKDEVQLPLNNEGIRNDHKEIQNLHWDPVFEDI